MLSKVLLRKVAQHAERVEARFKFVPAKPLDGDHRCAASSSASREVLAALFCPSSLTPLSVERGEPTHKGMPV